MLLPKLVVPTPQLAVPEASAVGFGVVANTKPQSVTVPLPVLVMELCKLALPMPMLLMVVAATVGKVIAAVLNEVSTP